MCCQLWVGCCSCLALGDCCLMIVVCGLLFVGCLHVVRSLLFVVVWWLLVVCVFVVGCLLLVGWLFFLFSVATWLLVVG